ncbi:MAG TPA: hypothetical protein VGF98_02185 [Candidatus Tumulicola sp.]|jgi:hypothetical protein
MASTKKEGPLAEARALLAGVINQPTGDLARARRLIDRALRETPKLEEEQRRIAAIVASRLHIQTADDMELFCQSYWASVGAIAGVVKIVLPPVPKSPGKRRRRLGPTSHILRAADLAAERSRKPPSKPT